MVDWIDGFTIGGISLVIALLAWERVEPILALVILAGFMLSIAVWRVGDGRIWEGIGWISWVGSGVCLVLGPTEHLLLVLALIVTFVLGLVFLLGGRLGRLPPIWTVDES